MATSHALPAIELPGYSEELRRSELDIATLECRRQAHPRDLDNRVRLAYRLFHRASLTGIMADFEAVDLVIRDVVRDFGPKEDLCLLKANLDFRFHRLRDVREDLEMCPPLPGRLEGRALLADLDFQEGRYEDARVKLEQLITENRTWDNVARLAYWKSKLRDADEADALYREAEDDLTAKEMRSYAWLELQRGVLAITHGRYADAWNHYRRAGAAFPGHWHTDEHIAELLAAEGRFDEAVALFERVIERTGKPELQHALGELHLLSGSREKAEPWFDRAESTYLASVGRGGVHYFHHLADFYADARPEPAEAVRFARMDVQMRSNFSTQAALAWALYLDGQLPEAIEYIRVALSSGVQDAGIFSIGATLFGAAGDTEASRRCAAAAMQINPGHGNFHMHH